MITDLLLGTLDLFLVVSLENGNNEECFGKFWVYSGSNMANISRLQPNKCYRISTIIQAMLVPIRRYCNCCVICESRFSIDHDGRLPPLLGLVSQYVVHESNLTSEGIGRSGFT